MNNFKISTLVSSEYRFISLIKICLHLINKENYKRVALALQELCIWDIIEMKNLYQARTSLLGYYQRKQAVTCQ
jgi:hypothetical protein